MARTLDEIVTDLYIIYCREFVRTNKLLLEKFIFFYDNNGNAKNILKFIYINYCKTINQNFDVNFNGNIDEIEKYFFKDDKDFEGATKCKKFINYAIVSVLWLINSSFSSKLGKNHSLFYIEPKLYGILNIRTSETGIVLSVEDKSENISYNDIYEYINERKSAKNLIQTYAYKTYWEAKSISVYNQKILNHFKYLIGEFHIDDYTDDENIIKHDKDIDEFYLIYRTINIKEFYIDDENLRYFLEKLLINFYETKKLILANLIINRPVYDILEFDKLLFRLKKSRD